MPREGADGGRPPSAARSGADPAASFMVLRMLAAVMLAIALTASPLIVSAQESNNTMPMAVPDACASITATASVRKDRPLHRKTKLLDTHSISLPPVLTPYVCMFATTQCDIRLAVEMAGMLVNGDPVSGMPAGTLDAACGCWTSLSGSAATNPDAAPECHVGNSTDGETSAPATNGR